LGHVNVGSFAFQYLPKRSNARSHTLSPSTSLVSTGPSAWQKLFTLFGIVNKGEQEKFGLHARLYVSLH